MEQINQHGSLKDWVATISESPTRDEFPWLWVSGLLGEQTQRPILLAYGQRDRMAPLAHLLAKELPADNIYTNDGGHKWVDWKPLWAEMLSRSGDKLFSR